MSFCADAAPRGRAAQPTGAILQPRIGDGLRRLEAVENLPDRAHHLAQIAHVTLDVVLALRVAHVREAASWAHLRRNFHDVWRATDSPIVRKSLERIVALYDLDAAINGNWLTKAILPSRIHRRKPAGTLTPQATARANAKKSSIRAAVEHIFAHQKNRFSPFIRTIGIARAEAKLTLANIAYTMNRLIFHERHQAMG